MKVNYVLFFTLKLVYRCLESLGRGKELRVSEHIKFIKIFTSNSFQVLVATGPFLKGCLTKGP